VTRVSAVPPHFEAAEIAHAHPLGEAVEAFLLTKRIAVCTAETSTDALGANRRGTLPDTCGVECSLSVRHNTDSSRVRRSRSQSFSAPAISLPVGGVKLVLIARIPLPRLEQGTLPENQVADDLPDGMPRGGSQTQVRLAEGRLRGALVVRRGLHMRDNNLVECQCDLRVVHLLTPQRQLFRLQQEEEGRACLIPPGSLETWHSLAPVRGIRGCAMDVPILGCARDFLRDRSLPPSSLAFTEDRAGHQSSLEMERSSCVASASGR